MPDATPGTEPGRRGDRGRNDSPDRADEPTHPALAAGLLMVGVTLLLVVLAVIGTM